ncbi:MAG: carboxypeptidase-like regulatory domain-containing protein, partial [Polyangiaceae bacterium]
TPPSMASSSHPSQTSWSSNTTAFYSWTFPVADSNLVGAYWVRDVYADTVPTSADNFLPVGNKQLIQSNLSAGIHFFHVVSVDTQGYLTKQAGHYQVRIGADPGAGVLLGQVVDDQSQPVNGASVEINRGLSKQTTNATGNYNFNTAIAGTGWEVRVRKAGYQDAVATVNVSDGGSTTRNFILVPLP